MIIPVLCSNNIVGLFTDEEELAIRKEYDFRERLKDSSRSEDSSIFTTHNLTTTENVDSESEHSKSSILAPFNSNESNDYSFMEDIKPMLVNRKMIKFCPKLREVNRQYERDNNSNIDNGVYLHDMDSANLTKTRSGNHVSKTTSTVIDAEVLKKMKTMGFEKSFVIASLNANIHNNATTCYYLLSEP